MDELRLLLRRHMAGMLRNKWVAVVLAWLICLGGWGAVYAMPDRFEASARVYIDADAVLTPLLRGIALDNPLAAQIETLQRTLLSRPNLQKLIAKTDLSLQVRGTSDTEQMVADLANQIAVVPQTHSLFTITYRNHNPQLAYDVVNAILGIFVEDKAGNSRSDMANATTFLDGQIASYEQQLRAAETKRATFRAKYIDLLPVEGSSVTRLDEARDTLRRLEGQLTDAEGRRDRLTQQIAVIPPTIVTEVEPAVASTGGGAGAGAAAAETRLREMLTTLTDAHPDVIRQRELIASLRGLGTGGARTVGRAARSRSEPNVVFGQLQVMLVQAQSDVASLTRQVVDARSERDRLEQIARGAPSVQAESVNLNRDYDVLRRNYEELLTRRESMRLSAAADTKADKVKLQVIDPPQVPQVPVSPRRGALFSLVFLAGLGGGCGAAFLLVRFDRSFHTVADLREMGLPIAGSISAVRSQAAGRVDPALFAAAAAAAGMLLLCLPYGGLMYQVLTGSRLF